MKITRIIAIGFGILISLILFTSVYNIVELNLLEHAQDEILDSTGDLYANAVLEEKVINVQILAQKWLALVQGEMSSLLFYLEVENESERNRLYKRFQVYNYEILKNEEQTYDLMWSDEGKQKIKAIHEKQKKLKEIAINIIMAFEEKGKVTTDIKTRIYELQNDLNALSKEVVEFVENELDNMNLHSKTPMENVQKKIQESVDTIHSSITIGFISGLFIIIIAVIVALFNHSKLKNYSAGLEHLVDNRTAELKKAMQDLEQSQTRLIQSEKMSSLGQLVAGVAHEINTPIGIGVTATSHFVEITKNIMAAFTNRTARKEDIEEFFTETLAAGDLILKNLFRTRELIKSFKMVSSDQTSQERRQFKVKAYLDDIILSLKPKLKQTAHEIRITCPDNIEIDSYPGAFSQVITNLIINSIIHAYDEKDKGLITIDCSRHNDNISLVYSDDGKGIPKENLEKIYDPFFTTNRGGGGTGLGLHIVYNIVHQTLKGDLSCESVLGNGTTFSMTLPVKV